MKASVLAIVAALLLGAGVAAAAFAARDMGKPPLTDAEAAKAATLVAQAISHENAALHALARHRILTAELELAKGKYAIFAAGNPLATHDAGSDSNAAFHDADQAVNEDKDGLGDLKDAQTSKGKEQDAWIALARKKIEIALALKEKALLFYETYSEPVTTTTPPPPAAGPLSVCIFIMNNGSTSTENAHVRDPGAGGAQGTVTFNGQGLNQTNPITLDFSGSAITPFNVSTFGTSTITATIGSQTASTTVTLDASNDNNDHSDCP